MYYVTRKWPILIEVETYAQENIVRKFLAMCELEYEWREDDTVRIVTTDPSQILYLKRNGIRVEYEKAGALSTTSSVYDDPLLE